MNLHVNSLNFWFPKIEAAGLPVPRTLIATADCDLTSLIDGELPSCWHDLIAHLKLFAEEIGLPCFLRTGHTSGKHSWNETCYLESLDDLETQVANLVEYSVLADIMGLPTDVWAVRELIETEPLFYAFHGRMPIVREFRLFVRDDKIEHIQPYWPSDAIEAPSDPDWHAILTKASKLWPHDTSLCGLAVQAVEAVGGGYWSVDFLRDKNEKAWLTDMADGDRSFRWES